MVAFGHTAIGAIIGTIAFQQLQNTDPLSGLLITGTVGVISHYIMDAVPHGHFFTERDYKKRVGRVIIFDLFLSIVIFLGTAFYTSNSNVLYTLYIFFAIGGAQLPDILFGLIHLGFLPKKGLIKIENELHIATHWHGKKDKVLIWSIWDIWQVAIFLIAFVVVIITTP